MKTFLLKIGLYLFLLLVLTISILELSSFIVKRRGFLNHQTESNLLFMTKNKSYAILLMGISHARDFSRYNNHGKLEKLLNKSIINIGKGEGVCGVNEQLFYLDYFYFLSNKTQKVVYILSPPLFFSESLSKSSNTFDNESFELDFFYRYLFFDSDNKKERISSYLNTKFNRHWFKYYPFSLESKENKLERIDSLQVKNGQDLAYGKKLSIQLFKKNCKTVEQTISLALKNNSEVVLIIPPALFGHWRGHNEVLRFGKKMTKYSNVRFYDFSTTILEPAYYYDHHHLNTNGILFFTEKYLKSIL